MFKEFLKIIPIMDPKDLKKLENSLAGRFTRLVGLFGKGLASVITKGSLFGIGFTLIQKLLNPLEAVEDRIKSLLSQSEDIQQAADNLDTSAGRLFKLRQLGASAGLDASSLDGMIEKFRDAIEKTREEQKAGAPLSASSQIVQGFAGEKDIGEGFFQFIQKLKKLKNVDKDLGKRVETEIFGAQQRGASGRFINSDFAKANEGIGGKSSNTFDTQLSRLSALNQKARALEANRNTQNFLNTSRNVTGSQITSMDQSERQRLAREAKELQSYDDLKSAALVLGDVKNQLMDINIQVNKAIGYLPQIVEGIKLIPTFFRRIFPGGSK